MYADKSTISATGNTMWSIEHSLNNDIQEMSNWCDDIRMIVNATKKKQS